MSLSQALNQFAQNLGRYLGLLAPGYAADVLLLNPAIWAVEHVWCDAHFLR